MAGDKGKTLSNKKSSVAQKNKTQEIEEVEDEENLKIWDCESPLYDSQELVSMNYLIESKFMRFPKFNRSFRSNGQSSRELSFRIDEVAASKRHGGKKKKLKWSIISKIRNRIMSWNKFKCIKGQ